MMNVIWVAMIFAAVITAAFTGNLAEVARASTDSAKSAVTLALGLVGVMAFWLGMMRILQTGGLLKTLAQLLSPVMRRLFPEIPADHPAMSMMILNISANMLGMANAATPFGIKAMNELDHLNPVKGRATNSMALFLAINTSGLALLPTGMIAVRASLGSTSAGSIFLPTMIATATATIVAILSAKIFKNLPRYKLPAEEVLSSAEFDKGSPSTSNLAIDDSVLEGNPQEISKTLRWGLRALLAVTVFAFAYAFYNTSVSLNEFAEPVGVIGALTAAINDWPLVILIIGFILFGLFKGVNIYDAIVEGGKEGFSVALKIIPFLVGILVAVGMLRASGALDLLVGFLSPLTNFIGMPAEALPMALLRPLSGSGAFGVSAEIMQAHGPDSLIGNIVATMQGSTETTFYVLAVYYGAVGIKKIRHTLHICLLADVAGILAAVWACRLLLG